MLYTFSSGVSVVSLLLMVRPLYGSDKLYLTIVFGLPLCTVMFSTSVLTGVSTKKHKSNHHHHHHDQRASGLGKMSDEVLEWFIIIWAGVQPTLDPYAEAFIAGPLR